MDSEGADRLNSPWYKDRAQAHPFALAKKFRHPKKHPFFSVAFFPWGSDSLDKHWNGSLNTPELLPGWKDMINEWTGAIAVGSVGRVYVLSTRNTNRPLCCELSHDSAENLPEIQSVAWALSQESPLEPLVLFSGSRVLYAFNVKKRQLTSFLRGHGGLITSIAVHPTHPYLFCTTSRDFTTRIYDLTLTPQDKPNNPIWPPGTTPSLAGAAHGLHMVEVEGIGLGRCVAILMGGRSGGHRAAVLAAAFHSVLPLIATCGLDRVVKIWHLPPLSSDTLMRQDKPLFSSSFIHKARVLSITWLSFDVLLSHSAPALMQKKGAQKPPKDNSELYFEEGTIALWRWLGMDRFFPPGHLIQKVLRGCALDFQESASFKLISVSSLPIIPTNSPKVPASPSLRVYQSPSHDPLVLFTHFDTNTIRMVNVTHFTPRKPKAFPPPPDDDATVVEMTKRLRLTEEEEEAEAEGGIPNISGWDIMIDGSDELEATEAGAGETEKLQACEMGLNGYVIVGVGSKGTVWLWSIPP